MRKRGARFNRTKGHVLTPKQLEKLMMPVHVAISLLPIGAFTIDHAHDLAAFTNIMQYAAEDAGRQDLLERGLKMAETLYAIKGRADSGGEWAVTDDERSVLMENAVVLDRWMRTLTSTRILRAVYRVDIDIAAAMAKGAGNMDAIRIAGRQP